MESANRVVFGEQPMAFAIVLEDGRFSPGLNLFSLINFLISNTAISLLDVNFQRPFL